MTLTEIWFAWTGAMGIAANLAGAPAEYREEADRLVASGRAWFEGETLRPLLPTDLRGLDPNELATFYRIVRATLWRLERGDVHLRIDQISAAAVVREHVAEPVLRVLAIDGLIIVKRRRVTAAVTPPSRAEPLDWEWLRSRPVPAERPTRRPESPTKQAPPPVQKPAPAAAAAPTPAPALRPKPAVAAAPEPAPEPKPRPHADDLIRTKSGVTRATYPLLGEAPQVKPNSKPIPTATAPKPAKAPTGELPDKRAVAETAPEPEPELSSPPIEPDSKPKPKPKRRAPDPLPMAEEAPVLTAEYLARITAATEASARLLAAATRQPVKLPAPNLRPTLIRICEWLHAAHEPLTAGALGTDALNRESQRPYRDLALVEGVSLGILSANGAKTFGRNVRYVVKDVSPLGLSWAALDESAAKIRSDRERRQRQKSAKSGSRSIQTDPD